MSTKHSLPNWIWAAPALAVGLAGGILIGKSGSGADGPAADPSGRPGTSTLRSLSEPSGADGADARATGSDSTFSSAEAASARVLALLDSPSRLGRMQRLLAFLDQLPDERFGDVYRALSDSPLGRDRQSERALILQAWAERDPQAATAHLQENEAEDWERETTLSTWASYDPDTAFTWALNAEDEGRVNNWVVGTLRGIASASPELARDYLVSIEDERTQRESMEAIQSAVMRNGFEAAESWIAGLEEGTEIHERAARYLANDLTELDPAAAGAWASRLTDPGTQREVAETVSEDWAREDLDSAREWVESLPQTAMTEAAEGITEAWANQDPEAAARWLSSLGNDPELDGAKRDYIQETWREHPEYALGMTTAIADPENRNRTMQRYLGRWAREDAEAARAWASANQEFVAPEVLERVFR